MICQRDSIIRMQVNFYQFMMEYNNIVFPEYQREYKWTEQNVEKMTEDILTLVEMKREGINNNGINLCDIVFYIENGSCKISDGQQRTVSIKYLIDAVNKVVISKNLSPSLLINNYNLYYDDLKAQTKFEKIDIEKNKFSGSHKKVYLFFEDFILSNIDCIEEISNIIKNDIFVDVKRAPNADIAYDLFVELNTGGKPLNKKEIIHSSFTTASERYRVDISNYTLREIELFLATYYENTIGPLPKNFNQSVIMSFINTHIVNDQLNFTRFMNYLRDNKNVLNHPMAKVFIELNKPVVLKLFMLLNIAYRRQDAYQDRNFIEKVFLPLALLCLNWKFKNTNPGGVVKVLLDNVSTAINERKSAEDVSMIITNFIVQNRDLCTMQFDDFTNKLSQLDNNTARAILIMDNIIHNVSGNLRVEDINLEHMLPQSPSNDWARNGWPSLSETDIRELVYNIGNTILLSEPINKKIQNEYITAKKVEYEKIFNKDLILRTQMNTVDYNDFEERKGEYIKERQNRIANIIKEEFPFGTILLN